jgi:hypothetical protein
VRAVRTRSLTDRLSGREESLDDPSVLTSSLIKRRSKREESLEDQFDMLEDQFSILEANLSSQTREISEVSSRMVLSNGNVSEDQFGMLEDQSSMLEANLSLQTREMSEVSSLRPVTCCPENISPTNGTPWHTSLWLQLGHVWMRSTRPSPNNPM